jgi:hypothetical protein
MPSTDDPSHLTSSDANIEPGLSQNLRDQVLHVEAIEIEEVETNIQPPSRRKCFLVPIAIVEIFVAPISLVAGMMASHGESWKATFVR